jgi:hypothetical protein
VIHPGGGDECAPVSYRARWTGVPARGVVQRRTMLGVATSMAMNNTIATMNTGTSERIPAGTETGAAAGDSKRTKGSETNIVTSSAGLDGLTLMTVPAPASGDPAV